MFCGTILRPQIIIFEQEEELRHCIEESAPLFTMYCEIKSQLGRGPFKHYPGRVGATFPKRLVAFKWSNHVGQFALATITKQDPGKGTDSVERAIAISYDSCSWVI